MKTIDINALEWFDRVNGNSYFAGNVTVNFGMEDERTYRMPFQYGYGDHYITVAGYLLNNMGDIKLPENMALWRYCKDNGIILRTYKRENCKKRELNSI